MVRNTKLEQPEKQVRITKSGELDKRAISSKKNASKARLVVREALKKTFGDDYESSSEEEYTTDEENFETHPIEPKKKILPSKEDNVYDALQEAEQDIVKIKTKMDKSKNDEIERRLKEQEEQYLKRINDYEIMLKEKDDAYIRAKTGTIHQLRKSMMLKF
jgi:hypothetical protein